MSPRWISLSTGATRGASTPNVLFERYADHNLMLGDPDDFLAGLSQVGNVLKNFGAKHAIERIVGELESCDISRDSHNASKLEAGLLEV